MANDVVDAITLPWESEDIPDADTLYMRVHHCNLEDGIPTPGAFRDREGGMSTDWNQYSTPRETQLRAKDPAANAVISMNVGDVRTIPRQIVTHTPMPENRSHTDVIGDKKSDPEVRIKFTRIYTLVLHYTGG